MTYEFKRRTQCIFIFFIILLLVSCATGPRAYFHTFSFNAVTDAKNYGHPDIEVLNYEYGSSGFTNTRLIKADWEILAQQNIDFFRMGGVTSTMPRGDYLYVKWRVKATGEVYEDKVDLTLRLPTNMTNYGLHFAIFGSQLYVYLFPPYTTKEAFGENVVHVGRKPARGESKTLLDIPYAQQHQIYPSIK